MQKKYNEGVIDSVTKWIMDNLDQRLSVDDIAVKSGYSKWYLQKLFARYHNETLARYIRKKKLVCCIRELKYSNAPIISLAVKYHFESQQSFTRSFKQLMGCTPLSCRKRQLGFEAQQQLLESSDPCAICRKQEFNSSEQDIEVRVPTLRSGKFPSRIDCVMR
ncbi:AraC family transcriptional regulator [Pantoea rodasii]|uniref:AraC family transcriptional regulator n=1 Tax=Pantoea rodasii TaxID=1076549 RepID=A0A2M9WCS8_9GAMM|nr:helix-turn-helix domain-containing protein [Pantoea rodasii]ORM62621.1 AraC family transcriptional regulator [Pantoea rodasii]PJZ05336.1 AraC family transcriptional regulator [Pantoea rodasii]